MKLPRAWSGEACALALARKFGYRRIHQTGSHIILQIDTPVHHRLAIPAHSELRIGTLNAILRAVAAAKGIDKREVLAVLVDIL